MCFALRSESLVANFNLERIVVIWPTSSFANVQLSLYGDRGKGNLRTDILVKSRFVFASEIYLFEFLFLLYQTVKIDSYLANIFRQQVPIKIAIPTFTEPFSKIFASTSSHCKRQRFYRLKFVVYSDRQKKLCKELKSAALL